MRWFSCLLTSLWLYSLMRLFWYALFCVPVEQIFRHVKQPCQWAKWALWTCVKAPVKQRWQAWEEREYTAWMRMATWTEQTLGCKIGPLNFSTNDLVLKQSIYYWLFTFRFRVQVCPLRCDAADRPLIFDGFVNSCASSHALSDENIETPSSSLLVFALAAGGA